MLSGSFPISPPIESLMGVMGFMLCEIASLCWWQFVIGLSIRLRQCGWCLCFRQLWSERFVWFVVDGKDCSKIVLGGKPVERIHLSPRTAKQKVNCNLHNLFTFCFKCRNPLSLLIGCRGVLPRLSKPAVRKLLPRVKVSFVLRKCDWSSSTGKSLAQVMKAEQCWMVSS